MEYRFDTDKYESAYIPEYLARVKLPKRILEVGVLRGGSLLLWCDLWPSVERVVGIDISLPLHLSHPKISLVQADQADRAALDRVGLEMGPFDLIVDDASHLGEASWKTFLALWRHVRPGGVYVVEDWGTGYWGDWPDGAQYRPGPPPGHTPGMAGMIKRLVDEVETGEMERLEVMLGLAFAYKRASEAP